MSSNFSFEPIGFLKSGYPDKFGVPRQSGIVKVYSELALRSDLQPELALQGLDGFSHVWLQFVFHLNNSARYHAKIHPPRLNGASIGVFATRSPHRPNPIGLSLVELVEIRENILILAGADLVDGTPILDVKPYLPAFESVPQAKGGWLETVDKKDVRVQFTKEAMQNLEIWIQRSGRSELQKIIEQLVQQDPRPLVYKGFESIESPYRNKHAFRLYDGDIHFEFLSQDEAVVFNILFSHGKL
ncbi:MAG: tRNA (N6-threonylcarbamoyladenosine(37)-N6)-methyltransferase TrmO [Bdellovibrionales bacterium RIFCSPHIGHO2_01_FULL_40_29]|nr:MAG: tRNA (N6-threonylcarbamoyladenosine(37)-N6)-methyltransferase TrmO [Bdellovibrionales bacterium RIFCSPHIGHO2_01_FULL_40_29]OFZ35386.1 MAG: tRNA (N6-threonylcarbamoyladenosine(37)-N6)-methyltransferase TrmO [Bdellovibrionales bacterium RIFCSPHIGHO2_02_FULL_40_15]